MAGLSGRRVSLRALAEEDGEALLEAVTSSREGLKRRLRWVSKVQTLDDCRTFIGASAQEGGSGDSAVFAVLEPRTGALAGIAALQNLRAEPGVAELSGWIRSDRQGKGYAQDAAKTLLNHAFRREGFQRVYARIDPLNRAARKVIRRLGFRYEGCLRHDKRLNGRWVDQECWGLLRSEWRK